MSGAWLVVRGTLLQLLEPVLHQNKMLARRRLIRRCDVLDHEKSAISGNIVVALTVRVVAAFEQHARRFVPKR